MSPETAFLDVTQACVKRVSTTFALAHRFEHGDPFTALESRRSPGTGGQRQCGHQSRSLTGPAFDYKFSTHTLSALSHVV
jgi:hypothetical protein